MMQGKLASVEEEAEEPSGWPFFHNCRHDFVDVKTAGQEYFKLIWGKETRNCVKLSDFFFNKGADLSVCLGLNWQARCLTRHWPGFPLVPYLFEKWMDFWELADCTAVSRKAKWNCAVPLQGNSHVHPDWHFLLISFSFPACGCKIWESLYKGLFSFLQPHHFLCAKWKLNLNWKVKLR